MSNCKLDHAGAHASSGHGGDALTAAWTHLAHRSTLGLARFSVGRVLLHLMALASDRCIRFHGAGILREIPGGAAALTLMRHTSRARGREAQHSLGAGVPDTLLYKDGRPALRSG